MIAKHSIKNHTQIPEAPFRMLFPVAGGEGTEAESIASDLEGDA
jgi:hypothetical protein